MRVAPGEHKPSTGQVKRCMDERRLACMRHYHSPSSSAWPRLSGRAGCEAATEALPLLQRSTSAAEAHGAARRRVRAPGTAAATRRRRARSRRRAAPRRPAAPAGPGRAAARAAARARPPAAARPAGPARGRPPQGGLGGLAACVQRAGRALMVHGRDGAERRSRRPMPGWQLTATGTCGCPSRCSLASACSTARCNAVQRDQPMGHAACGRARRVDRPCSGRARGALAIGGHLAVCGALEDGVLRQRHRAEVGHEQRRAEPRAERVQACDRGGPL